jgi:glyoxylase-like metal-dependent hydrolase (beta-lactamase superfamily II)
MKRALKIGGLVLACLLVALGVLLALAFAGGSPIRDGERVGGVEVVKDSFVSVCIVDLGGRDVMLVDTGTDPDAKAVLAALGRRHLGADAVKVVLLTHGDWDHVAGVRRFPSALVMALDTEVPLVEGREDRAPMRWLRAPRPNGNKVTQPLHDGDTLELAGTEVRVFAAPGHTKGSAVFLARGVLFMGDSAEAAGDGTLGPGRWLFTESRAQNVASLRQLAARLAPDAGRITAIACGHSGMLHKGLAPLTELAARLQ